MNGGRTGVRSVDGSIDEVLSNALGGVDASSTSKNKYREAIAAIESALGLQRLLIKSLGAPKNYGNRISEATGMDARCLILVADGDVDQEALVRAYEARAVRLLPTLVVLKQDGECVAVEVLTEGDNPFPGVEARVFAASAVPSAPTREVLDALFGLDGCGWEEAQQALHAHQARWTDILQVKHAPDQNNLMNRIREAAGRRPPVLAILTTPDLRVSCGRALEGLSDVVGESVVVTDGPDGVRVELATVAAAADDTPDPGSGPEKHLAPEQTTDFVVWNAVLLRDFFSPTHANEEVTLSASKTELDDVAPELGGFEGLLQAVQQGPPWELPRGRDLTNLAVGLRRQRRRLRSRPPSYVHPTRLLPYGSASDNFPTYLPILAALVALSVEYQHGKGGFYEHSRSRLSLNSNWGAGELEQINSLWDDLESWTTETGGRYGVFRARVLGKRPVIGRLKSQSIIRDSDIDKLHRLFARIPLPPGETLVQGQIRGVLTRIHAETTLSQGLRDASTQEDYRSPLVERLDQILQDWDGSTSAVAGEHEPWSKPKSEYSQLGVALLTDGGRPPWRLGWRVPAFQDDGHASLVLGETARWRATFDGGPYAVARPEGPNSEGWTPLLSRVTLSVSTDDGFRPSQQRRPLEWSPRGLTVLEARREHSCLIERGGLPQYGAVYLLVSPENTNFDHVVKLAGIVVRPLPSQGLPAGWRLLYIPDAAELNDEQRALLLGIEPGSSRSRAIGLVGGLRIRRAGRIAFLPHDLPMVEVDAPKGSEIRAPGLELNELKDEEEQPFAADGALLVASTRRTFEVQVSREDWMAFTLTVSTPAGQLLGTARLRLAVGNAEQAEGDVALVPACHSAERGVAVRGMTVTGLDQRPAVASELDIQPHQLGGDSIPDLARIPLECPEMRFLDALAQGTGQMSYGRARNLMRRYLENHRDRTTTATFESLRQRGMLEIRADSRGRWTTVGAVRPTIYALSMRIGEDSTWGVCGTLSLDHWRQLANTGAKLFVARDQATSLPVFRLRGSIAESGPFELERSPPTTIAMCSASLDELREAFGSRGFEPLGERAQDREWFQPLCADWSGSPPPAEDDWVLLRYTDPDTGSHRLHSLRNGQPGEHRYRHVRNERWATWITYDACVRQQERLHPSLLRGVAPWPLSYHSETHSVWVPARMRLPLILERALVACSGAPPSWARLVRAPAPTERRLRGRTVSGAFVGDFDMNYSDFLQADSPRLWLQYQHVPAEVVDILKNRLGCRLDEIGDPR
jgi:hypothetical protein